ncbi:Ubiquitin-like domain containing protein [Trypanosoma brucei equiperdum]|uniref:Ubiquitin-like domain containing protein n=1 Tax=Trypanosoma brucei equiperdum TaxID=630700 RepID=A0A3L6LAV3_9TRYP|nr:Ubiquitin-like domain containing protein [Trypanosoma brucei equiperdum]
MASPEVSFMDAVRERYGAPDDSAAYSAESFLVGEASRRRNKKWELVGMEKTRQKQADHSKLVHVVLRGMNITVAESTTGELAQAALHRLEEVDLSENFQLTIREVGRMAQHLPALKVLQLSHSPELFPVGTAEISASPFESLLVAPHLRKLVLNHVGVQSIWQLRAVVQLPLLEELHLDNNGIKRLALFVDDNEEKTAHRILHEANKNDNNSGNDIKSGWFPAVNTLSLAQNELSSWGLESGLQESIGTAFPGLKRLFLTSNRMPNLSITRACASIVPHGGGNKRGDGDTSDGSLVDYAYLQPLELLCLNENPTITDACTLDAVRYLCPHLTTFRITYSAIFPQWNETLGRMYVVASLPSITTLNRGQVRAKERMDSEIFYIQRGMAAEQKQQVGEAQDGSQSKVTQETLRYPLLDVLREKHKDVITVIYREGETASHDGTMHMMLNIVLRCDGFEDTHKRVPSSMSVGKLKALVRAVYSVAPSHQHLSFVSGDAGVVEAPTQLDNELQSLSFYGMCDRAIVLVVDTSLRS